MSCVSCVLHVLRCVVACEGVAGVAGVAGEVLGRQCTVVDVIKCHSDVIRVTAESLSVASLPKALVEFLEYKFAHDVNCARNCAAAAPAGSTITGKDCFDYRLARAKECPLAMIVLLELQFTEGPLSHCSCSTTEQTRVNYALYDVYVRAQPFT